jgi:excisionase family DNA binding protein
MEVFAMAIISDHYPGVNGADAPATHPPPGKMLTTGQAAAYLNVSPDTLRRWSRRGLPRYKLGRLVRWSQPVLDAWLRDQLVSVSGVAKRVLLPQDQPRVPVALPTTRQQGDLAATAANGGELTSP